MAASRFLHGLASFYFSLLSNQNFKPVYALVFFVLVPAARVLALGAVFYIIVTGT
jgi:hypothetical protein